jgi:2-amino-4-hydroxy-6-hydroxymethyldihydropteridine diphosphokinase
VSVRAFIGLGSNLDAPAARLQRALEDLELLPDSTFVAASPLYANPPFGPVAQGEFVNAVAAIDTSLAPRALLGELRRIEAAHGRVRDGTRWGPRTLDLDILMMGQRGEGCLSLPELEVPHPRLHERAFALEPLCDLAPDLRHPVLGATIAELARRVRDPRAVRRLADGSTILNRRFVGERAGPG